MTRPSPSERRLYTTYDHSIFFELVLDACKDADIEPRIVVDIGPGDGTFAAMAMEQFRSSTVHLLEGNPSTVDALSKQFDHVELYRVPDPVPRDPCSVGLLHVSHVVEHLSSQELYQLMIECDRVLEPGGLLAISAPLHWTGFYGDLSHVRPYNPEVFIRYLCDSSGSHSREPISTGYCVLINQHRYQARPLLDSVVSDSKAVERALHVVRRGLARLGLRSYSSTGFTLILQKQAAARG